MDETVSCCAPALLIHPVGVFVDVIACVIIVAGLQGESRGRAVIYTRKKRRTGKDAEANGASEQNEPDACIVVNSFFSFLQFYLANEHFESGMLVHGVAQKLVDLFSAGGAAYFLLQGVVCQKNQRASQPLPFLVITS